jgi:hypothetical protein
VVFRAIDSWYGFSISTRFYGKYLTDNFPIAVSAFIILAVAFCLVKLDVEKEKTEKEIKKQADKDNNL